MVSFGSPTVEPLLLSLAVADSLDETIAVNRADLFAHYFRRLLKVESEGQQISWEALRSILEKLAEWFMLTTGRRGLGLPHRTLVRLMLERAEAAPLLERIRAEYGLSFESELAVLESLSSAGILRRGIRWSFRHDTFEEYFAACRIITGIEEDDPVDLDIWKGAQEKDFVRVVQFIRDMASDELRTQILSNSLGNLTGSWRAILQT